MSRRERSAGRGAAAAAPPAGRAGAGARDQPSVSMLVTAQSAVDAGDRSFAAGEREPALGHYGRALNDYLRGGLFGLAASVARRMIERYPDVVRARMTLAAISLSEGLRFLSAGGMRNSCAAFREYVAAAETAGQQELAIRQLRRFARATESAAVRDRIGEFLAQLGDAQEPPALQPASDLPTGEEPPATADQRDRWVEVLIG